MSVSVSVSVNGFGFGFHSVKEEWRVVGEASEIESEQHFSSHVYYIVNGEDDEDEMNLDCNVGLIVYIPSSINHQMLPKNMLCYLLCICLIVFANFLF